MGTLRSSGIKRTPTKAIELARTKLASSGLDEADAKALGIRVVGSAQELSAEWPDVPALKLVYYALDGVTVLPTYRARLLGEAKGPWGEVLKLRYLQPGGTPPAAYLPSTLDWATIAREPGIQVLITEGELKAACAAKHGLACIGLGGVSSFRSAKRGWMMLPELEAFAWEGRDVVICYDSDARTNPDVAAATAALVRELSGRGAKPRVATLPERPNLKKVGLDDLIVDGGLEALDKAIGEAKSDELSRKLWEFNERFAWIGTPGFIYDELTDARYDPSRWKNVDFANIWAAEIDVPLEGKRVRIKQVQVAPNWIEWAPRRAAAGVTYEPGAPKWIHAEHGALLNEWSGWGVEPIKGDTAPWSELLDYLFTGAPKIDRQWFERWCLYPLAHPGAKLHTAVGMWSRSKGLGKSLVGQTLGRIYGTNYSEIRQEQLEADFTGWAVRKQFALIDEVSQQDSRRQGNKLKALITEESFKVNIKYLPEYEVPSRINYYLTSNHPNAFYVEDRDRRWFIHEVAAPRMPDAFFERYHEWLKGPGPAALFWHAQHFKFGDFKPYGHAPTTRSKEHMVEAVKGELDLWLTELAREPASKLRTDRAEIARDVFNARELLAFFDRERTGRETTAATMATKAREHLALAANGELVKVSTSSERLFAVRNPERWARAPAGEVGKYVREARDKERGGGGGKF